MICDLDHEDVETERAVLEGAGFNLTFIPLQDKFDEATKLAPADHWLRDGVHPTTEGHELIKREWLKGFERI